MITFLRASLTVCLLCVSFFFSVRAYTTPSGITVADSVTRTPLAGTSVFDRKGTLLGICDSRGRMPYADESAYPLTFRCIGYKEKTLTHPATSTILLAENPTELPEVRITSRRQRVLYIEAYIREYSVLSTYTDTVYMFREKRADFMIVPDKSIKYRGWTLPRTNRSRSYYRFSNAAGLDSVSSRCNNHFTWSDWVGVASVKPLPKELLSEANGTHTIMGLYSPSEIWSRDNERVTVDLDILADRNGRKWVPGLATFFRENLEFDSFSMKLLYDNVLADSVKPENITAYSYNLETRGRGHDMFMFNKVNEPFFVSTYAEIYFLNKEYITVKEAKKKERPTADSGLSDDIEVPANAPPLQNSVIELIARVNSINNDEVRAALVPDRKLVGIVFRKQNFGDRLLQLLKSSVGLSELRGRKKTERRWNEYKKKHKKEVNIIRIEDPAE